MKSLLATRIGTRATFYLSIPDTQYIQGKIVTVTDDAVEIIRSTDQAITIISFRYIAKIVF